MNFILTEYIYPLESEVVISKFYNLTFDNPRTEEEIRYVEKLVKTSYTNKLNALRIPESGTESDLTLESFINDFHEKYGKETLYGQAFFEKYNSKKIYNHLARMWVICRYNDNGEHYRMQKEYQEMAAKGEQVFFLLDDESPIVQQENILKSYCHILSVLFNDSEGYYGSTFLLSKTLEDIRLTSFSQHLNKRIMMWGMGCSRAKIEDTDQAKWDDWFYTKEYESGLLAVTEMIEQSLSSENSEKIIYIGNLLENAASVFDPKYRLVILVGILELLLTHNPDFSRFNVEDSIKKQFVLKTSTLVYLYDNKINLEVTRNRLKVIYDQRSNIAHGNFNAYNKYIKGLSKKAGKEEYFDDLIADTYFYIKAILTMYFRDKIFVDHLKDG